MINLLRCEFLKLKRSRMLLISFLGALATPVMVFVGVIKFKIEQPGSITTYTSFFSQCNLYMMLLFGLIVYTVIASYLFSREYTENTLKTILTVPVSKISFIIGKFIMLLLWILCLTFTMWLGALFLAVLSKCIGFSIAVLTKTATQCFFGAILMYLMLSPFVFLTLKVKNLVVPIIAATTVAMINIALVGESVAALFPWSSFYLLATGGIEKTGYSIILVVAIIAITSIAGFVLSIWYFIKEDVR